MQFIHQREFHDKAFALDGKSRDPFNRLPEENLVTLLERYCDAGCSEECDRVYALLSLAADCQEGAGLQATYGLSPNRLVSKVLDFCNPPDPVGFAVNLRQSCSPEGKQSAYTSESWRQKAVLVGYLKGDPSEYKGRPTWAVKALEAHPSKADLEASGGEFLVTARPNDINERSKAPEEGLSAMSVGGPPVDNSVKERAINDNEEREVEGDLVYSITTTSLILVLPRRTFEFGLLTQNSPECQTVVWPGMLHNQRKGLRVTFTDTDIKVSASCYWSREERSKDCVFELTENEIFGIFHFTRKVTALMPGLPKPWG